MSRVLVVTAAGVIDCHSCTASPSLSVSARVLDDHRMCYDIINPRSSAVISDCVNRCWSQ